MNTEEEEIQKSMIYKVKQQFLCILSLYLPWGVSNIYVFSYLFVIFVMQTMASDMQVNY